MVNAFSSENQFWTEIALSGGWVEVLAVTSSTLSAKDVSTLDAIKAFGVANSYWRPRHREQFMAILRKALTQVPGAAD